MVAQVGKECICSAGDPGSIPGSGRSLEKEMATCSSILPWEILWTEEPGRLQSTGTVSDWIRHTLVTKPPQHTRFPCPSPSPRVCSNSCPLSQWIPSNHLILCHLLLLLPSVFPSIRVFFSESALPVRWPKYWRFSFSISPSNKYSGFIYFRIDWFISLQSKGLSRVFPNITVQKHQFFGAQPSLWSNSHIHTWLLEKP